MRVGGEGNRILPDSRGGKEGGRRPLLPVYDGEEKKEGEGKTSLPTYGKEGGAVLSAKEGTEWCFRGRWGKREATLLWTSRNEEGPSISPGGPLTT